MNYPGTRCNAKEFATTVNALITDLQEQYINQSEHIQNVQFSEISSLVPLLLAYCYRQGATSYKFTLCYEESLHVRAEIPTGATHVSVLLNFIDEPCDPVDTTDTIYQEFDMHGKYVTGGTCNFTQLP